MDGGFINGMENLHLGGHGPGKSKVVLEQNNSPKYLKPLDSGSYLPFYQAWVIYRKESENGQRPDWTDVEEKKMSLSSASLEKKVRDTKRRIPVAEQLQVLGRLQRDRVDDLIRRLEREDYRYQWTCEYAKIKAQEVRRKGDYRGSIRTVELNVVMMRKLRPQFPYKSPTSSPTSTRNPFMNGFPNPEPKAYPEIPGMGAQFGHRPVQGGFQAPMAAAGQHPPSQYPHHRPDMMGAFPPQQKAPGGQPAVVPDQGGAAGPKATLVPPGIEILRGETPLYPRRAPGYVLPQSPGNPNVPRATLVDEFAKKSGKPHANMTAFKASHQERRYPKSPKMPPAPEPVFFPDSSSEDDDDSMRFREGEDSSATEDPPEERTRYPRGSLHPQRRYLKQRQDEQPHRVHYRKLPQMVDESDKRRYSTSYVDVIPGNSLRSRREPGKAPGYDSIPRARPRVIQDDLHLHDLDEKLRERQREREYDRQQRTVHDHIRSRLQMEAEENELRHDQLQEQAETLKRWEMALDYRQREHEARILNRGLPFRDPLRLRHGLEYSGRDDLRLHY
jgi:hypothetical protein